jgi:hypothetical protein
MLNTVSLFLSGPDTQALYKDSPAFVRAVNDLQDVIDQIVEAGELQSGRKGPAADANRALRVLADESHAIAACVHACAVDAGDDSLALRNDYSRTDITKGSKTAIVARCRDILKSANDNADELKDYQVTPGDLTSLKKRIENFDGIKSKPREKIATSSAATKRLPKLFRQANALLTGQLDKLVVKLNAAQPKFFGEYKAARKIVGNGRTEKKVETKPVTTPA